MKFRAKDIILDFTSLLDVIMIILFYFIMNAAETGNEAFSKAEQAEAAQKNADSMAAQAQTEKEKYEDLSSQIEKELQDIELSGDRKGLNLKAINEFGNGRNIKINLIMNKDDPRNWTFKILRGNDESLGEISNSDYNNLAKEIADILETGGFSAGDSILCDFNYNSNGSNTHAPYSDFQSALEDLKKEYGFTYFYCSENDFSALED